MTEDAAGQYAERFDLGLDWSVGAPVPQMVTFRRSAFIVVYTQEPDPDPGDPGLRVLNADDEHAALLGVIHLHGAYAIKIGGPNEEAIHGHPLSGKGLDWMGNYRVRNSEWITEAQRINSVHPYHRGGWHDRLTHYIFAFHDETLECLVKGISIERYLGTPDEVLIDLIRRKEEPPEHGDDEGEFDVDEMFRVP